MLPICWCVTGVSCWCSHTGQRSQHSESVRPWTTPPPHQQLSMSNTRLNFVSSMSLTLQSQQQRLFWGVFPTIWPYQETQHFSSGQVSYYTDTNGCFSSGQLCACVVTGFTKATSAPESKIKRKTLTSLQNQVKLISSTGKMFSNIFFFWPVSNNHSLQQHQHSLMHLIRDCISKSQSL